MKKQNEFFGAISLIVVGIFLIFISVFMLIFSIYFAKLPTSFSLIILVPLAGTLFSVGYLIYEITKI